MGNKQNLILDTIFQDEITAKKIYCKPQLTKLGDLRTFTLGGTSSQSWDSEYEGGVKLTLGQHLPPPRFLPKYK